MIDSINLVSKHRKSIMGIAALWIFYCHVILPKSGIEFAEYARIQASKSMLACFGVVTFFMISGIGLTYSIGKHRLGTFYYNRVKRVFLPFFLFALFLLSIGEWSADVFIGNVTGLYFLRNQNYCTMWFIPSIILLYIIFPFYYKLFQKSRNKMSFTGIVLFIWATAAILLKYVLEGDFTYMMSYIPAFFIGVYLGWRGQNIETHFDSTTYIMFAVSLIPMLILTYRFFHQDLNYRYSMFAAVPTIIGSVSLVFVLSRCMEWLCNCEKIRGAVKILFAALNFFGMISFELYICQEWLAGVVKKAFSESFTTWQINLVSSAAAIAVAYAANVLLSQFWKIVDGRKKRIKKEA